MLTKKLNLTILALAFMAIVINAQENYAPFYKVGTLSTTIETAANQVKSALKGGNFNIIGEYHPGKKNSLYVIAFTRDDIKNIALSVKDRGALAIAQKVGLVQNGNQVTVSLLNPEYMCYAYFMDKGPDYGQRVKKVSNDIKNVLKKVGNDFTPFGGEQSQEDLSDYHYMMMMPYFDDPVELNEFTSFEEGLKIIKANLAAKKGNTVKVYELIYKDKQIAVFGVGLLDPEEGEAAFLPVIGEDHVAAMPYEIILQGNEATMLHGKYRFALLWPELSMKTFMKISGTPGDVEDFMEALTE